MASNVLSRSSGDEISHLIIVPGSTKKYMTENIPYPFRQNSNFFYLTGSYDPEALLVLTVTQEGNQVHPMFLSDPDPISELWVGRKTSPRAAVEHFGVDRAYVLSAFEGFLREFALATEKKFVMWCEDRHFVERVRSHFLTSTEARPVQSPKGLIDSMRVIKSAGEIRLMKKSCQIASEAFQEAIHFCGQRSGTEGPVSEHQIWAKIDYECRLRGAERLAYPPVVASGGRANIIHYVYNTNKCGEDEMVLVDAGCEFFGYCSDITRTWPVSGSFTNDRQRSLYEMVLYVQSEVLKKVEPGNTLERLFKTMGPLVMSGLQELGIVKKSIDVNSLGATDLTLRFCPHHVSHYLGMDVHDTPTVERHEGLKPGMIITVEPGIYLRAASSQKELLTKVGKEFDGIGIRIEDDVLVTPNGHEVLTAAAPKTVEEIERWAGDRRPLL
jgi:Xaa-Pro aminopeptidase